MAFTHGMYISEKDTSIVPSISSTASLPIVFGTAPVNLAKELNINKPIICYSYAEAVEALGYSNDFKNYTLCEFMYSFFVLYGGSPAVFVNVLDPAIHKITETKTVVVNNKEALLEEEGILLENVTISGLEKADYTCAFNKNGYVLLTLNTDSATILDITYEKLDASLVKSSDIIGGIDVDGNLAGLELVGQIYPKFGLVPGIILAPGFSSDPEISAVMNAKTKNISSIFSAMFITDIADTVIKYADAVEWKNKNIKDSNHILCFGKLRLGDKIFNMSSHLAGLIAQVDDSNDGIPSESHSNKVFKASALVVNGKDYYLDLGNANFLNSNGIVTAINIKGELRAWGNRTSLYPTSTDIKDIFIPVRRMFNFLENNFMNTFFIKVDKSSNRRLIDSVVDSYNIYLNGLSARGFLLDGKIEFLEKENPATDMVNGIYRFHTYITPPTPAETIENVFELDVSKYDLLFIE